MSAAIVRGRAVGQGKKYFKDSPVAVPQMPHFCKQSDGSGVWGATGRTIGDIGEKSFVQ